MKDEIIDKIASLFSKNIPFQDEAHIVYLLVQTRKLLEREQNYKYPVLRFYCDWSVHTKKDKITPAIKNIMERIYEEMQKREMAIQEGGGIVSRKNSISFLYMDGLKKEMEKFLDEYNISKKLLENNNWKSFLDLFVKILIDQEVFNPCEGIEYFKFLPSNNNSPIKWKWAVKYKIEDAKFEIYEADGFTF
jgi:hypothetical protein